MNHWPRGFVLLATLLACLCVQPADSSTVAEFDRATRLEMTGDYEGAVKEYESYLARAPKDRLAPVAAMAIANVHLLAFQDSVTAMKAFDRVLKDYPQSLWAAEAARGKAECAEAQGSWAEAGEAYSLALDIAARPDVDQSDNWINDVTFAAANAYYLADNQPKVIETYEKVLGGAPPPDVAAAALYRLGETYESGGETGKAASSFAQVLETYPSTDLFGAAMAKRELIASHVDLDWEPLTVYSEGTALLRGGNLQEALGKCDEVLAGSGNAALKECAEYRKITLETTLNGDFTGGCDRLRGFIEKYPDGLRAEDARATLNDRWTPVADMEVAVREDPENADLHLRLGRYYQRVRSTAKAVEALNTAVALDPENEQAHLQLGYAHAQARNSEEALKEFEYYLERNPDDVNTLNMIGYTYIGMGDPESAIPYFERYAEVSPDEANAHDSLGEGYMTAGRLEDAAREYRKAIELDPSFSNSYFMLGRVYQQMEKKADAIETYQLFLELNVAGPQADQARAALEELRAE